MADGMRPAGRIRGLKQRSLKQRGLAAIGWAVMASLVAALPAAAAPPRKAAAKKARAKKPPAVAAPAAPDTSPATAAVAHALKDQARGRIGGFYASRGYWPLWVRGGAIIAAAAEFVGYLETAGLDGLDPQDYGLPALREALASAKDGTPQAVAAAELRLSQSFARYVRDVRRAPDAEITFLDAELAPQKLREDAVLRAAALPSSFADYVKSMGWMSPLYVSRRAALATLVESGGPADAERLLRLNLDRARLLPGPWTRHVVVDAASARLWYYGDGRQQGTMRVVVGTPETPTPMLAGMVRYAILNPYWNIPPDLVARKVAPKMRAGGSLAALGYQALSDWSAAPQALDDHAIDWQAVADGRAEVRVRQLPGGSNAMGRVKFMFPNDLGIYLHDTPDKALMKKEARFFSNGCVRLEDAQRLGAWFFGKPLKPAADTPEQNVPLPQPVPVYLTYLTAAPSATGVTMLADIYGRDGGRAAASH